MHRGYVKLWRKSLDSQIWANTELWKVWCWCMMRAAHKTHWVSVGTGRGMREVQIDPGQFIFSREAASRDLKMKPSSVRNRMEKLKKLRNLDMQPDTHCTIVTLLQWQTYAADKIECGQPSGQRKDNGRTTVGQRKDNERTGTRKVENVKNDENEKKPPKSPRGELPSFEDFWQAVAKHKRKNRKDAVRRHTEAVASLRARFVDASAWLQERAIAYYTSDVGKTKYALGPAPWLNQGGYDDDPESWKRKDETNGRQDETDPDPSRVQAAPGKYDHYG